MYSIRICQSVQKKYYDQKHVDHKIEVGEYVFLSTKHLKSSRPSRSLIRDIPTSYGINNSFHVSLLTEGPKKFEYATPLERVSNTELVCEIDGILNSKYNKRKIFYLVKWKECENREATWEPLKNLTDCMESVYNFHNGNKNTPSPKPRNFLKSLANYEEQSMESMVRGKFETNDNNVNIYDNDLEQNLDGLYNLDTPQTKNLNHKYFGSGIAVTKSRVANISYCKMCSECMRNYKITILVLALHRRRSFKAGQVLNATCGKCRVYVDATYKLDESNHWVILFGTVDMFGMCGIMAKNNALRSTFFQRHP
ncbi:hypothetical protein O9G_005446 [Rozella allomycis CSF55]|uniref:Chromo domain-containing protein n=1 Tax=Rozella allomycis (strain CSF55) TaxID=988480 RepID=A0A075AT64_ROZAC|nr:hypothetical protein O9G_005446 [Rozella allomycis CSF55]|eukprot:EPZ31915.1 hypothetical protein O9G_005446 [Rozella allomycis CSF55]